MKGIKCHRLKSQEFRVIRIQRSRHYYGMRGLEEGIGFP
jgi:hypothetical protein